MHGGVELAKAAAPDGEYQHRHMVCHRKGSQGNHRIAQPHILDEHYPLAAGHRQSGEDAHAFLLPCYGEAADAGGGLKVRHHGRAEAVGNVDDIRHANSLQPRDDGGASIGAVVGSCNCGSGWGCHWNAVAFYPEWGRPNQVVTSRFCRERHCRCYSWGGARRYPGRCRCGAGGRGSQAPVP